MNQRHMLKHTYSTTAPLFDYLKNVFYFVVLKQKKHDV